MQSKQPSEAQTKANQANAKKSTGPKTQQGKAVARFNARRHGLTGQFACMSEGDEIAYMAFEARLLPSLAPVGGYETQLAISIVQDQWRLNRARGIENNMFAHGNDMLFDEVKAPTPSIHAGVTMVRTWLRDDTYFTNIALYATRLQRIVEKNEKRLRELQAERKAAEAQAAREAELLVRLALMKGEKLEKVGLTVTKGIPSVSSATPTTASAPQLTDVIEVNGFVFSLAQITLTLNREQALEEAKFYANRRWDRTQPYPGPRLPNQNVA